MTHTTDYTVTVVIPARNAEATLDKALNSVFPSRAVGEIILIDDGSDDATIRVARQAAKRAGYTRLRILDGPSDGIAAALNVGFAAATCPYVLRCDADDLLLAPTIAARAAWLAAHPDYCAISAGFETILEGGQPIAKLATEGEARDVTQMLQDGQTMTHFCTWLIRREAVQSIKGARTWFTTAEDIDLQFRLSNVGRVWHDPHLAYQYCLHDRSITHIRSKAQNAFFDEAAHQFAMQRGQTGIDDLMAGKPPVFDACDADAQRNRAHIQASHLLRGQAWRSLQKGRKMRAVSEAVRAVQLDYTAMQTWKNAAGIMVRSLAP